MTRINAGILPEELPSKLLLAEHREIKRIPNMITSGKARVSNLPEKFTLGTGHVKFFYDKQCYLHLRYIDLYLECVNRDFQVQDYSSAWGTVPRYLFNDWTPSDHDRQIIIDRIESKGFKLLCPSPSYA